MPGLGKMLKHTHTNIHTRAHTLHVVLEIHFSLFHGGAAELWPLLAPFCSTWLSSRMAVAKPNLASLLYLPPGPGSHHQLPLKILESTDKRHIDSSVTLQFAH